MNTKSTWDEFRPKVLPHNENQRGQFKGGHMKIRAAATSLALGALLASIAIAPNALAAKRLESLGAADQNAVAHFNVYLPLTHTDALDRLLQSQTDQNSANYH
ncbi:MAG TPA: hypothetical protein VHS76_13220, partial [Steroidobacteraceae bacterium]|nr:hypothetical protein [Steroidobacteraceae bacterium]